MPRAQGMRSAQSNSRPSGIPQGTPGGQGSKRGTPRVKLGVGGLNVETTYLWLLIAIEIGVMVFLRQHMRRYHGG